MIFMKINRIYTVQFAELHANNSVIPILIDSKDVNDFRDGLDDKHMLFFTKKCIGNYPISELFIQMNHEYVPFKTLFENNDDDDHMVKMNLIKKRAPKKAQS